MIILFIWKQEAASIEVLRLRALRPSPVYAAALPCSKDITAMVAVKHLNGHAQKASDQVVSLAGGGNRLQTARVLCGRR